ncbi:MAG: hypothetical protein AAGB93_21980 [Planctomycetota bacterium]
MGEVLARADGEVQWIAPGYPPYALTTEIPEEDVTGRVLLLLGDWD